MRTVGVNDPIGTRHFVVEWELRINSLLSVTLSEPVTLHYSCKLCLGLAGHNKNFVKKVTPASLK
tara:strand:+ start:283 stop:477 length:195 start_codon:yes stop_codon:yes gene_type:complete